MSTIYLNSRFYSLIKNTNGSGQVEMTALCAGSCIRCRFKVFITKMALDYTR